MSGRRRKGHAEEHHVDERWLVSYADMITVLMALFIVLYALSTVNQKKFDELKNSLASGFGTKKSEKVDQSQGIVRKEDVKKDGSGFSNSTIAVMMAAQEIADELKAAGLASKVSVAAGTNEITLSLVGASAYFGGNDATLSPQALGVLQKLSPTLKKHAGVVTIEGHADPHGSAGQFGNDWNLGFQRASSVGEYLLDHSAIKPSDISFLSMGSQNAKAGSSQAVMEYNRRVDIVLHSVQVAATPATTEAGSGTKGTASTETASKESSSHVEEQAATTEESSSHH